MDPTSTILVEAVVDPGHQAHLPYAGDGGLGGGGGGSTSGPSVYVGTGGKIFPTYDYAGQMELLELKTQVVQVQTTLAAVVVEMVKATILPNSSNRR